MAENIPQNSAPLLEAVNASVYRSHSHALAVHDVNWKVNAGEFWVVGGRHGSGKSAFLATMSGLRPPASGTILHFGCDLAALSESDALRQRKRSGYVFKGGGRMLPDLSVAQNIALPLRYHHDWTEDEAEEFVETLLADTELTPFADHEAHRLTTGWQQRVGLARALALQPDILFLDAAMAGLELSHREWWRKYLRQLADGSKFMEGRKMTLVAATSDFTFWGNAHHHFAQINDGRLQIHGPRDTAPEMN